MAESEIEQAERRGAIRALRYAAAQFLIAADHTGGIELATRAALLSGALLEQHAKAIEEGAPLD